MILDQADSWEQYLPLTQPIDCLYADEYWLALSYICSPLQLLSLTSLKTATQ